MSKPSTDWCGAVADEMRRLSMEQARRQEAFARAELRRLKTHRMNVRLCVQGHAEWRKAPGTDAYYLEDPPMWLEMLLPRGPRPLP